MAPGQAGVAHWDLHTWNVIDEPARGPVVIDWTATTVTDNLDFCEAMAAIRRLFGGVVALPRGPEALGDAIRSHR